MSKANYREAIMKRLRGRSAPTTQALYGLGDYPAQVEEFLSGLVQNGTARCTNGLWYLADLAHVDNRKPRGPKRLNPKSVEARRDSSESAKLTTGEFNEP